MFTTTSIQCFTCGMQFDVPSEWNNNRRNDKTTFYCPNGHHQAYIGKTDKEKLADKEAELARAKADLYRANDDKYKMGRKLDRLKNGVCSECNRTFVNLQRHMKSKHGAGCKKRGKR